MANEEIEYVQITNQDGEEVNVVIDDDGELALEIRELDNSGVAFVIAAETENSYDEVIGVFLGDKELAREAMIKIVDHGYSEVIGESVSARELLKFIGKSIIGVPKNMTALEYLND